MFAKLLPKKSSGMASNFPSHYDVYELLGKGAFGTVKRCVKRSTNQEFAVKIINKRLARTELEDVLKEVNICRKLKHPNVVRLFEIFDQRDDFYLVFDLVVGGELMHDIEARRFYSEFDASKCIESILGAINYCHKMNIVHRDLKPQNILLASKMKGAAIKIADFGLAIEVNGDERRRFGSAGTAPYMAPEALTNDYYGKPVDVWSCGVILYLLLIGDLPFPDDADEVILSSIYQGVIKYPADRKDTISKNAKDLVNRMLTIDYDQRITTGQALLHPWIYRREQVAGKRHLGGTIVHLKKFNARRKFKAAIIATIAANKLMKKSSSNIFKENVVAGYAKGKKADAQQKNDEETRRQEIFELTEELISACNAGDSRTVQKLCDVHVTTFDSNGNGNIVEGMEFYKLIFGNNGTHTEILDSHVHLLGDTGACVAYVRLTYSSDGEYDYAEETEETIVWHKIDGKWSVVHFHSGLSFEVND